MTQFDENVPHVSYNTAGPNNTEGNYQTSNTGSKQVNEEFLQHD